MLCSALMTWLVHISLSELSAEENHNDQVIDDARNDAVDPGVHASTFSPVCCAENINHLCGSFVIAVMLRTFLSDGKQKLCCLRLDVSADVCGGKFDVCWSSRVHSNCTRIFVFGFHSDIKCNNPVSGKSHNNERNFVFQVALFVRSAPVL